MHTSLLSQPRPTSEFPFVGSNHRSTWRYVYVLRLANNDLYVGCTADPERRIAAHRAGTGAIGTRMSMPVCLVSLCRFEECYYAGMPASERIEMHTAFELASQLGVQRIQGARHGSGERFHPSDHGWRAIRKNEKFIRSDMGRRLLARVEACNPGDYDWLFTTRYARAA